MRLGILRRIGFDRVGRKAIGVVMAVLLILMSVFFLSLRMKAVPLAIPVFESVAESRAKQIMIRTAEELLKEDESADFCTLTYAADGSIKSVWVDSGAVNRFLAELSRNLETELSSKALCCQIKSGDLIFPKLFSGSGLSLSVRGSMYGGVSARAVSDLVEGGLNQTLHRLEAEITAPLTITVLGEETQMIVTTRILISETVIVGELPGGIVVGG